MAPISEVRGAIIYAVAKGIPSPWDFIVPVAGNLLVIPILLALMQPILNYLKERARLQKLRYWINHYEERAENKLKRYNTLVFLGLYLFVAIPLPTTGAYTGILAALLLKVPKGKTMLAISLGVFTAALITWLGSHGVKFLLWLS